MRCFLGFYNKKKRPPCIPWNTFLPRGQLFWEFLPLALVSFQREYLWQSMDGFTDCQSSTVCRWMTVRSVKRDDGTFTNTYMKCIIRCDMHYALCMCITLLSLGLKRLLLSCDVHRTKMVGPMAILPGTQKMIQTEYPHSAAKCEVCQTEVVDCYRAEGFPPTLLL